MTGGFGMPNAAAPRELVTFDFLVGAWECESSVRGPDGIARARPATWVGRYILDGYAIADEFRQLGPAGEVAMLGQTLRTFNTDSKTWVMKWLDALDATWLDLGPEDLGGMTVRDGTISYRHRRPRGRSGRLFPMQSLFRVTFFDIAEAGFHWRSEVSTDNGETWAEAQTISARRQAAR
ncbi:MAG TPA: hypothetical protein VNG35_07335 [Gemmatimonadales bacterium]|nr:hypothetical protein [Gemmatimonadales bacterium]